MLSIIQTTLGVTNDAATALLHLVTSSLNDLMDSLKEIFETPPYFPSFKIKSKDK